MSAKNQGSEQAQRVRDAGVIILNDQESVEPVAGGDLAEMARDEAFMAERVIVRIFSSTDPNSKPYAEPNVNGKRAVIWREIPTSISRAHLEVLARMKETRYVQHLPENHVGQIDETTIKGSTGFAYQYEVLKDTDRGRAWHEHVRAEQLFD